jgi:hypothetical protein
VCALTVLRTCHMHELEKNTMRGNNLWEISVQLKIRRVIIHTVWEIKIPFGETVYIILNIVSP